MKLNLYILEPPFAILLDEGVDGGHHNRISGTRHFDLIGAHHSGKLDQVQLPVADWPSALTLTTGQIMKWRAQTISLLMLERFPEQVNQVRGCTVAEVAAA